jgi:hypothetical protein
VKFTDIYCYREFPWMSDMTEVRLTLGNYAVATTGKQLQLGQQGSNKPMQLQAMASS